MHAHHCIQYALQQEQAWQCLMILSLQIPSSKTMSLFLLCKGALCCLLHATACQNIGLSERGYLKLLRRPLRIAEMPVLFYFVVFFQSRQSISELEDISPCLVFIDFVQSCYSCKSKEEGLCNVLCVLSSQLLFLGICEGLLAGSLTNVPVDSPGGEDSGRGEVTSCARVISESVRNTPSTDPLPAPAQPASAADRPEPEGTFLSSAPEEEPGYNPPAAHVRPAHPLKSFAVPAIPVHPTFESPALPSTPLLSQTGESGSRLGLPPPGLFRSIRSIVSLRGVTEKLLSGTLLLPTDACKEFDVFSRAFVYCFCLML